MISWYFLVIRIWKVQNRRKVLVDEVEYEKAYENYSCFYCNKKRTSENQLIEHKESCRGSTRMFCTAPVGLPHEFTFQKPQLRLLFTFGLLAICEVQL